MRSALLILVFGGISLWIINADWFYFFIALLIMAWIGTALTNDKRGG